MSTSATSAKVARERATRSLVDELGDWNRGAGAVHRLLARAIEHAIDRGALPGGRRLPSERELALAVSVSRGTAVAAYDLLVADDRIERRRGSGTYVVGAADGEPVEGRDGTALVHRLVDASGRFAEPRGLIDLSLSVPHDASAVGTFHLGPADLAGLDPATGYSPWGIPDLRAAVADHVTAWGLDTDADQIVITSGAQQAISVAATCWVRPGDTVVVDDPTYPGAVAAFAQAGARLVGVGGDADGLDPRALATALAPRPALVYLQPAVQSPTGTTWTPRRRAAIADVLVAARVPVVEDRSLVDLAWRRPPPPLASALADVPTVVVGSLGKRFWGGLRVGFTRTAAPLALRIARIKATHDLGTSAVSQLVAVSLLRDAGPSEHPSPPAQVLAERCAVLASALRDRMPGWRWPEPTGGLSLWVDLGTVDGSTYAAIALRHGVAVAAPGPLTADRRSRPFVRLSFAPPAAELVEAADRLAAAWNEIARP